MCKYYQLYWWQFSVFNLSTNSLGQWSCFHLRISWCDLATFNFRTWTSPECHTLSSFKESRFVNDNLKSCSVAYKAQSSDLLTHTRNSWLCGWWLIGWQLDEALIFWCPRRYHSTISIETMTAPKSDTVRLLEVSLSRICYFSQGWRMQWISIAPRSP